MGRIAVLSVGLLALLAGCATVRPTEGLHVNRGVGVADLRRNPEAHRAERVVLGGEIVATRPRPEETEIEILDRPLRNDESPRRTDRSDGRFLVRTTQFLDPAVYAAGRRITVVGTVAAFEERRIGDLPYRYPVLAAERIYLWAREPAFTGYPYAAYPYPFGLYYSGPYYYDRYGRRYYPPSHPLWPHWW